MTGLSSHIIMKPFQQIKAVIGNIIIPAKFTNRYLMCTPTSTNTLVNYKKLFLQTQSSFPTTPGDILFVSGRQVNGLASTTDTE